MPYPEEFPHKILNIGRAFSEQELKEALGKAVRNAPAKVNKYRVAYIALADKGKRLEYEAWLPHENVELERDLKQSLASFGKASYLPEACPRLEISWLQSDLGKVNYREYFTEVKFKAARIMPSTGYDRPGPFSLPVIFDK
jgi:hypothetical protein